MTRDTRSCLSLSRFIVLALACLCASQLLSAQPRDNTGRDFVLAFPPNLHYLRDTVDAPLPLAGDDSLYIFISAVDVPAQGTISYRDSAGNAYEHPFTVADASMPYTFRLPWRGYELVGINDAGRLNIYHQSGKVAPQSFRITTDRNVSVHALNRANNSSDAMLVFPTDVLGTEYRVMSYTSHGQTDSAGNIKWGVSTPSQFAVVAAYDNTVVTFSPTAQVFGPVTTGTFSVTLNKGDSYLLQARMTSWPRRIINGDLTGTLIQSTRPVAVFSGHQCALLPVNSSRLISRNYLIEQMPPVPAWGKIYFITPFPLPAGTTVSGSDIYRVLASTDNTLVFLDGVETARLQAGEVYEAPLVGARQIVTTENVLVAQFKRSSTGVNPLAAENPPAMSDPLMVIVPPRKQFRESYELLQVNRLQRPPYPNDIPQYAYEEQYCTIIALPDDSVAINGIGLDPKLFRPVASSCYSFLQLPLPRGSNVIRSLKGKELGVLMYGYGLVDAYGYPGGLLFDTVPELNVMITGDTEICLGDSVQFSVMEGGHYTWLPEDSLSCRNCPNPTGKPKETKRYILHLTTPDGCYFSSSVLVEVYPYPQPIKKREISICRGQGDSLRPSKAQFYSWSPPEGLSCTDCPTPFASPSETTVYKVVMHNGPGCAVEDSIKVVVRPSPEFDLPEEVLICGNESTSFDLPEGPTYQWAPKEGLSCSDCPNPVVSPRKTTKYTVVASNREGCRIVKNMTVKVVAAPVVSITPDTSICEGQGVRLRATGGNFYRWSPSDGLSCDDCADPIATPGVTTTYTVDISINSTCKSTTTVTVSVVPAPAVALAFRDTSICAGTSVQLFASGGADYRWEPKEGLSCTDCPNPTATPETSVTYRVSVGNGEGSCTASDSVSIVVLPIPEVDISPSQMLCAGDNVQLEATGGVVYSWLPAEGLSCTDCPNPMASPKRTMSYEALITDGNGCSQKRQVQVEVLELPDITVSNDTTICLSGVASLRAEGSARYEWSPVAGLDCTDCPNPRATPSQSTMYYVRATDNDMCYRLDSVFVEVRPCEIDVAFQPLDFGAISLCDTVEKISTLVNNGSEPLGILSWQLLGTDAASFRAELLDHTLPFSLQPGASLRFRVACHPHRTGPVSSAISVLFANNDQPLTAACEATGIAGSVVFSLGPDIRTDFNSRAQLDIQAGSDAWSAMMIDNLELVISYKASWLRYGGVVVRGPALDNSWQFSAQERSAGNDMYTLTIRADGSTPIAMSGTIATVTLEMLASGDLTYTPHVEGRAVGRERCVETEGGSAAIDIAGCIAELRGVRYGGGYDFRFAGGTVVPKHHAQMFYTVAFAAETRVEFYSQFGELVAVYNYGIVQPGEYSNVLDLSHLATGTYIARCTSGPFSKNIPLLLGVE